MTAREKALRAMWHRWGEGCSIDAFRAALEQPGWGDVFMRVLVAVEHDIETGRKHFCEVCETIHPPVGPGQELLLPSDHEEATRVLEAHVLDEVHRAGPEGVPAEVVMSKLLGEAAS